jgi:Transposase DDE domain
MEPVRQRSIVMGKDHDFLQQRRKEQLSPQFRQQMHRRNAIEGTISELVRAHGLRRSRYRGFAKVELQNLFIAAACNIKRWLRALEQMLRTQIRAFTCLLGPLNELLANNRLLFDS